MFVKLQVEVIVGSKRPRKIYLAARYSLRFAMQDEAKKLNNAGYDVISSWIYGDEEDQLTPEGLHKIAQKDIDQVRDCDILVTFSEPAGSYNRGGGRHTELGLAMAWDKPCVLIGPKEQIFHHWYGVTQYNLIEDFIDDYTS